MASGASNTACTMLETIESTGSHGLPTSAYGSGMIAKLATDVARTSANAMPATTGMAPIARKASPQAMTAVPITGGFVAAMAALPKVDRIVDLQTVSNKDCWPHHTASPPKAPSRLHGGDA